MAYHLSISESMPITVNARDYYSSFAFAVKQSQIYLFERNSQKNWWDLWVKCGPEGYINPIASHFGLRIKDAKCFTLCGAYGQSDEHLFYIGAGNEITMDFDDMLYLFANDTKGFYWNNFGAIDMKVTRIA